MAVALRLKVDQEATSPMTQAPTSLPIETDAEPGIATVGDKAGSAAAGGFDRG